MIFGADQTMSMRYRVPIKLAMGAVVLTAATIGALAADKPVPESPPAGDLSSSHRDIDKTKVAPAEPGKEWWRDVVARFPNCATLTDGCQSCVPHSDSLTCSNPGIACTRTEWRCSAEIKPEPPPKNEKPAPKQ
jgi:hypothetical protein